MTLLERTALQFLVFLNLPEARERKGSTYCSTQRLLLQLNLGSGTAEGRERLEKQIVKIKADFGIDDSAVQVDMEAIIEKG